MVKLKCKFGWGKQMKGYSRGEGHSPPQSCHTFYSAMVFTQHQEGLVQVTKGLAPTYLGLR